MVRTSMGLLAGVAAATFMTSALAEGAGISGGVVKVGVLTDMSGPFSDLAGKGSIAAVKMAVDDFVATGKPSFKVEMISADHQNKIDIAASTARKWYDSDGVDVIVDAINSGVALAVSNVAQAQNKMLIVTGSGTTALTNEQCTPNTISYTWDTYAYAKGTARLVKGQDLDSWYFVAVDYALGKSLVNEATAALKATGGKIAGVVYHPIAASDFSSFILQAQASKAKVVALANAGGDLLNSIKAANDFAVSPGQRLVPIIGTITEVHALGPKATQGMLLLEPFYWNQSEASRTWSKRYKEVTGKMPNFVQAGAYSATMNYLKAVKAVGADDPAAVMKYLNSHPINDIYARNGRIREDGRMVYDLNIVEVKKPSEISEDWDYYTIKEVIPGDEAFQPLVESRCKLVKR